MTPFAIHSALEHLISEKLPVFLWGPPGIGKSTIVKDIALQNGLECLDLRLSLLDPTDLRGLPFFDAASQQAVWAKASFLPHDPTSKGILFLDELNAAPPMVQAAAYQLILDRRIGEYTLPQGWAIIAAGNRENDRGVVFRMPSPLANRFVHLEMEVSAHEWRQWALERGIDPLIISFITFRPDALFSFGLAGSQHAFATPRTWEYVHKIITSHPSKSLSLPMIGGTIGEDLAAAFLGFCEVATTLPDIDAIIKGEEADVPQDAAALHILSTTLAMRIISTTRLQTLDHLLTYTLKMPGEFAVMIINDLRQRGISLDHSAGWPKWLRAFNHLTIA